jgi:serine protease AprX
VVFRRLPMVAALATPAQIDAIRLLAGLQSIYLNITLQSYLHESVPLIGATSVWQDYGITGQGIGVAILDTGLDATHADLALGQTTAQNVKILGLQYAAGQDLNQVGLPVFYQEGVPNSDITSGHGTHVAGIVAASGAASDGYYKGVAPGAHLVGLGAGDVIEIFTALAGFDYVLAHQADYNIRVVNCSWGNIVPGFDPNNPVNVATKRVHDAGVTVVFASGNSGANTDTLNT